MAAATWEHNQTTVTLLKHVNGVLEASWPGFSRSIGKARMRIHQPKIRLFKELKINCLGRAPYKQGPTKFGAEQPRYSFHPCSIIYRDCGNGHYH